MYKAYKTTSVIDNRSPLLPPPCRRTITGQRCFTDRACKIWNPEKTERKDTSVLEYKNEVKCFFYMLSILFKSKRTSSLLDFQSAMAKG